jgi:hypothetical protein
MKLMLTIALSALTLGGSGCALTAPKEHVYASRPVGDGDPNATSCYAWLDTGSRMHHKQCKSNAEWARIQAATRNQCGGCQNFPSPSSAITFPR